MRINQATVELVKEFEGLELSAYRDPVGIVTIGYGYTNNAGFGPGVKMGDTWTEQQAEEMLRIGLERFGEGVARKLTRKPTDNQFGAMVSLAYNIGLGAFGKSTCLRRFNAGDMEGAAQALTWFNKAGGKVLRGLVRRREAERALFLSDVVEDVNAGGQVTPDPEKKVTNSTTVGATFLAFFTLLGQVMDGAKATVDGITENFGVSGEVALFVVGTAALLWIFRERVKKITGLGV